MPTNDTLNPPPAPARVYYQTGRMLGVEDFQAEQDYHRGRLARALLQLFGTGTAYGLKVQTDNNPDLGKLEVQVTPGVALDRVGRIIEVPRTICIRIQNWLAQQTDSDLNLAFKEGKYILCDVFATFVACTRGVTPCFATMDDYDATDAFSPNRLLDSFAMVLVLRTDSTPKLPADPWLATGPVPTPGTNPAHPTLAELKQALLDAAAGPNSQPVEYPPLFDATSVFLARIQIAATQTSPGTRPSADLTKITIDNLSRLFLFPESLVARWTGLSSGTES